ncbi:hypothetical protein BG910_06785 [Neisseria chenwenguii]|uniref:Uncharacterized protein n=1 Tax=Neisseria chenwenguii TaxID=1853278 RepID=A0A220S297_9NEIS|nr:hypothetical protein BG910_06785 [Neisseria chenwenguii]
MVRFTRMPDSCCRLHWELPYGMTDGKKGRNMWASLRKILKRYKKPLLVLAVNEFVYMLFGVPVECFRYCPVRP